MSRAFHARQWTGPRGDSTHAMKVVPAHIDDEIRRLEQLADLMDSRFVLPGTDIRFGLDSLVGLIPGIGDLASGMVSVYLMNRARALGVPKTLIWRMAANIGVDFVGGAVPLIGDVFDVAFKSNRRNIALLKRHFERHGHRYAARPGEAVIVEHEPLRKAG